MIDTHTMQTDPKSFMKWFWTLVIKDLNNNICWHWLILNTFDLWTTWVWIEQVHLYIGFFSINTKSWLYLGFASADIINHRWKTVFSICGWKSSEQRADWVYYSTPFYIRDLSIWGFWYPGTSPPFIPHRGYQRMTKIWGIQKLYSNFQMHGDWHP